MGSFRLETVLVGDVVHGVNLSIGAGVRVRAADDQGGHIVSEVLQLGRLGAVNVVAGFVPAMESTTEGERHSNTNTNQSLENQCTSDDHCHCNALRERHSLEVVSIDTQVIVLVLQHLSVPLVGGCGKSDGQNGGKHDGEFHGGRRFFLHYLLQGGNEIQ